MRFQIALSIFFIRPPLELFAAVSFSAHWNCDKRFFFPLDEIQDDQRAIKKYY